MGIHVPNVSQGKKSFQVLKVNFDGIGVNM